MDTIKPNTVRFRTVGICIGERCGNPTTIPLLTTDRTGVAANAGVEIDYEAKLFCWRFCRKISHCPDLKFTPYFRIAGLPPGETFPGNVSNCGQLSAASSAVAFSIFTRKSNQAAWPVTGSAFACLLSGSLSPIR
jgi:hypothetical protein